MDTADRFDRGLRILFSLGVMSVAAYGLFGWPQARVQGAQSLAIPDPTSLQGDWYKSSVGGCYFDETVLAIRGDEILLRNHQMEAVLGYLASVKTDGVDLLVSFRLTTPLPDKSQLFEVRLHPEGSGFRPTRVKSNAVPDARAINDSWFFLRCDEPSAMRKLVSKFGIVSPPYNPGPHERVKDLFKDISH